MTFVPTGRLSHALLYEKTLNEACAVVVLVLVLVVLSQAITRVFSKSSSTRCLVLFLVHVIKNAFIVFTDFDF